MEECLVFGAKPTEEGRNAHREELVLNGDLRGDVVLHLRLQLQLSLQQLARQRLCTQAMFIMAEQIQKLRPTEDPRSVLT